MHFVSYHTVNSAIGPQAWSVTHIHLTCNPERIVIYSPHLAGLTVLLKIIFQSVEELISTDLIHDELSPIV